MKPHITMNANTFSTKYDVVRYAVKSSGMKNINVPDDSDCLLIWSDSPLPAERIASLKAFQRVNHFPGMSEICRKDSLARNMNLLKQLDPENFDFTPQTWIFPADASDFQRYLNEDPSRQNFCFIAKPPNQAMGKGIRLYLHANEIPRNEPLVVQRYIANPFVIEGFKFDLRIYVLVTSCDPLRIFLFPEGLVRFSTEHYQSPNQANIYHRCMHLTNYSVNKDSENYRKSSNNYHDGSKRSLDFLFTYLRKIKHPNANTLWGAIADLINKTLIAAEPYLFDAYRVTRPFDHSAYNVNLLFDDIRYRDQGGTFFDDSVCFEILGFDILLDDTLKPWLLEVNRSPSFRTSEQIDLDTKSKALIDSFTLLNLKRLAVKQRRANGQQQRALKRLCNTPAPPHAAAKEKEREKDALPQLGSVDRSSSSSTSSIAPSSPGLLHRSYSKRQQQSPHTHANALPPLSETNYTHNQTHSQRSVSAVSTRRTPRPRSPALDETNSHSHVHVQHSGGNGREKIEKDDGENYDDDYEYDSGKTYDVPLPLACRSPGRKLHGSDRESEELKNLLIRVRIQEDRFDYETSEVCANVRFKRIFPCGDHISQKKYSDMLITTFKAFLDHKITDEFCKYLPLTYDCRITEDDVKQMLEQRSKSTGVESQSVHGYGYSSNRVNFTRKNSQVAAIGSSTLPSGHSNGVGVGVSVGVGARARLNTAHASKYGGRRTAEPGSVENRASTRSSSIPV